MSAIPIAEAPRQTCYINLKIDATPPQSRSELLAFFNLLNTQGKVLNEQRVSSAIAEKLKRELTKNNGFSIDDIAHTLNYSRHVLTRAFKKSYGITPIQYRHRIRIFYFLWYLSQGYSVTESIQELDIADAKTFIIQFKKFAGIVPCKYKPKKKSNSSEKLQTL